MQSEAIKSTTEAATGLATEINKVLKTLTDVKIKLCNILL